MFVGVRWENFYWCVPWCPGTSVGLRSPTSHNIKFIWLKSYQNLKYLQLNSFPTAFALIFVLIYFCHIGVTARKARMCKTTYFLQRRVASQVNPSSAGHASTKAPVSKTSVLMSTKEPQIELQPNRVLQLSNVFSTKVSNESASIANARTKEPNRKYLKEPIVETQTFTEWSSKVITILQMHLARL